MANRQWIPRMDMNFDQILTITDCWLWIKWWFFLPGDSLFFIFLYKLPTIGVFFEISESSFGSLSAGIISTFFWFCTIFSSKEENY